MTAVADIERDLAILAGLPRCLNGKEKGGSIPRCRHTARYGLNRRFSEYSIYLCACCADKHYNNSTQIHCIDEYSGSYEYDCRQ